MTKTHITPLSITTYGPSSVFWFVPVASEQKVISYTLEGSDDMPLAYTHASWLDLV